MFIRQAAAAATTLFLISGCGPLVKNPRECHTRADCADDSLCSAGKCVASAPPRAAVGMPATPILSHSVVRFDGTASTDPDPSDSIVSYSWTVRKLAAPCDPFPQQGVEESIDVVFGCEGTFEVVLQVVDSTQLTSSPAVAQIEVAASNLPPPSVIVGADIQLEHRCQGEPLVCTPLDAGGATEFTLEASATSPTPGSAFTYLWTVEPPRGIPSPRILPSRLEGPNPVVRIETDGTAIAGDYYFTVTAKDGFGQAAVGTQKVTIGNRPPLLTGGGTISVPHQFDPVARRFTASGTVPPFQVTDPDNDPVVPLGFTALHRNDGAGTFELVTQGWSADFTISVPYASPADGAFLIGGAGLVRNIALHVQDVNGASVGMTWDVAVTNRAPRIVGSPAGAVTVGHTFDAATSRYLARAELAEVVDDDGDPIAQSVSTGDTSCATLAEVVGSGKVAVECARAYSGVPALLTFAGTHVVQGSAADPWAVAGSWTSTVTITNRAPRIVPHPYVAAITCGAKVCCDGNGTSCFQYTRRHAAGPIPIPFDVADDDGDPIQVSFSQGGCLQAPPLAVSCLPGACADVQGTVCADDQACGLESYDIGLTASDGVTAASGTVALRNPCYFGVAL